jgi:hypothetical protein
MLSGIKRGKRKRDSKNVSDTGGNNDNSNKNDSQKQFIQSDSDIMTCGTAKGSALISSSSTSSNQAAADELRRLLSRPIKSNKDDRIEHLQQGKSLLPDNNKRNNDGGISDAVIDRLEKRGRIKSSSNVQEQEENIIVLHGTKSCEMNVALQKEDFRSRSRKGKLKQIVSHSEADKSISQLVAEEKQSSMHNNTLSMDEQFARNISRLGSRYKGTEFNHKNHDHAEEEDYYTADVNSSATMKLYTASSNRLTDAAILSREKSRQVSLLEKQQTVTSKCWWWMESSSFQKHMLLSLGDYVTLVLAPTHFSLLEGQCFLVPIKHAESFVSCDHEVWDEVHRFQNCLRSMFRKEGKGVLFCETVLSSKGLWQARMDVIPVPINVENDAEIYFKSALTEQAEEWGTHTKILSTKGKGIGGTVPKGFPYFNIEWEGGGFATIIESDSFPKTFGVDTIAGMLDMEPVKFNRKPRAKDNDRKVVVDFLDRWQNYDWTLSMGQK